MNVQSPRVFGGSPKLLESDKKRASQRNYFRRDQESKALVSHMRQSGGMSQKSLRDSQATVVNEEEKSVSQYDGVKG